MAAVRKQLEEWFDRGAKDTKKPTHMIVVCDTFDHEDYPVYVYPGQDAREVAKEYDGKNMQRIMEVYSFSKSREEQFAARRVYNY